jgi:NitT/TauT family transport system permease protein
MLPGVGSYIAQAIDQRNLTAVGYAVLVMFAVILLYDQLLFRPLVAWSAKFKSEEISGDEPDRPWFLTLLQRAHITELATWSWSHVRVFFGRLRKAVPAQPVRLRLPPAGPRTARLRELVWDWLLRLLALAVAGQLAVFVATEVGWHEVLNVFALGLATAARVLVLIALASIVWVPVGVWIGMRPHVARRAQPIAQFLAAFPANLFFPIAVSLILRFHLNVEIWISPLMILGTQWYILFNVIAGASALPTDLHYVANNLGLSRFLWWRRLILPGIFPAYVTGALTASGGSWNASIVSEVVHWGDTTLTATGVGAYIAGSTESGDFPRIALGIGVLCLYVIAFNRLLWRRLYDLAAERLRLD